MSNRPDLADLLLAFRHDLVSELHTMMPGKIVKYYPATQTADVQPMLKRVYWSDTEVDGVPAGQKVYTRYPVIPNVPVEFPGGQGFIITFPLAAGDTCDIEFSEASLADYLATGEESEQQDVSRHKLSHAVVHPIFCPTSPSTDPVIAGNAQDRMVVGKQGAQAQIQITGSNILLGAGATQFAALANLVDQAVSAIVSAFNSHTHPVSTTGTSTAQTGLASATTSPISPAPGSVAATVTKVE